MGADSEQGKRLQEMAERCVFDCKNAYDGDSIAKRIVQALEEAFQAGVESVKAQLLKYGNHLDGCLARPDCSCGWEELLASLSLQGRKQEK